MAYSDFLSLDGFNGEVILGQLTILAHGTIVMLRDPCGNLDPFFHGTTAKGHLRMPLTSPLKPVPTLPDRLHDLGLDRSRMGFIVVDHGSRRAESNSLLLQVVELFQRETGLTRVEPAHMEIAEPTIAQAYDRCVERGAEFLVVYPYFLGPGRHWHEDIPRLAREAAVNHPQTQFLVAAPLGLHVGMIRVMEDRIADCLRSATLGVQDC
ncbi:MAG: hypothetical protein O2931_11530, partial [Planctomycetota bacterium]|nr:hypothetical protein [Planctomycetota bacterium]